MYVKVSGLPRISPDADRDDFVLVSRILERHGYQVIYFEHDTVAFYDTTTKDSEGYIHYRHRYVMARKSFAAFVDVLKRLDGANAKLCDMVVKLNTMRV